MRRSTIVLAHALAVADQLDGLADVDLVLAAGSRDGLQEAAARLPGSVAPCESAIAETVHRWFARLLGDDTSC